jgi:hypothetical protein
MLNGSTPGGDSDEPSPTLHRLAEALDIAPTAFLDANVCELSQTVELLCLWNGIADSQVRAMVLAIVQTVVSHV